MNKVSEGKFIATAVQASPVLPLSRQKTTEKIMDLMSKAAKEGSRLIVFPETFIPTYPNFSIDLQRPTEWQQNLRYLLSESVFVPGPEIDMIAKHAKDLCLHVSLGINERVREYSARLYNTQVFINADGKIIGVRRKLLPTNREKVFWTAGDGTDLQVYDTELGKIGGLICYENLQPLFKYALMAMGEEIHCACWPGWPEYKTGRSNRHVIDVAIRQYALEGQCFVVNSCMYIDNSTVPPDFFGNAAWVYFGGSGIVNPMGEYVAGPVYDKEAMVHGEIDLSLNLLRKSLFDIMGKEQRWDVIQLAWNKKSYGPFYQETHGQSNNDSHKLLEEKIAALKDEITDLKNIVKQKLSKEK
ncbi:MAG: Aliphatic nitrilase [Smithella sp. PtaU1.Bin162]|nr:MAG: Aliphatic nitrilase [Smithella sp. PtaU1.Bin162]